MIPPVSTGSKIFSNYCLNGELYLFPGRFTDNHMVVSHLLLLVSKPMIIDRIYMV